MDIGRKGGEGGGGTSQLPYLEFMGGNIKVKFLGPSSTSSTLASENTLVLTQHCGLICKHNGAQRQLHALCTEN